MRFGAERIAQVAGAHEPLRLVRARTLLYGALMVIVAAAMLAGLWYRTALQINVLRDRGVLFGVEVF